MQIRELIYPRDEKKFFIRFNIIAAGFIVNIFLDGAIAAILSIVLSAAFVYYIHKFTQIFRCNEKIRNSSLKFLGGVAVGCALQSGHIKKKSILIFGNDREGRLDSLLESLERIGVTSVDKIHVGYGRGHNHLKDFILHVVVADKNLFKITHSDIEQIQIELKEDQEATISMSNFYFVETVDLLKYVSPLHSFLKRFK